MNWKWLLAGAAALLAGVSIGALSLLRQQHQQQASFEQAASQPPPVPEVSLQGVVGARDVVSLPAPIEGVLVAVMVNVGDEVYEGMLLAQIDNTSLNLDIQLAREELAKAETKANDLESETIAARLEASRAEADLSRARDELEQARTSLDRQSLLYREGATPRQVYDKVQREYEKTLKGFDTVLAVARTAAARSKSAQRSLDLARKRVDEINQEIEAVNRDMEATEVLSPVAGIITGMAARQGEEVNPDIENLFQIAVDLTRMYVVLEPDPARMELLHPGQRVRINVAELPDRTLEGTVTDMRVGRVEVDFTSPTPRIRPGLTARVTVPAGGVF